MSQMVDVDWGTSDHHLTDVAANKVASKVFSDMTILCISIDFVPSKKSKKVRMRRIFDLPIHTHDPQCRAGTMR